MSAQGGLRHAGTEPSQLANKRERRRGAAGRAAALRRAPSDSDCSGETASLSADSADRAPRPLPPTTRSNKSRSSRRRGSEWEVLEGLKDGQRFEKRPEVFNGYLHKKRKWPLKGWHKRFFVIDGGILVYARSPTDVARGRLHGSVDVGLSVISAKQRRRRIDIDADEFIYHLRAKTPDVFRTWLLVLKAHRLYRQHLLTFGARESAPKIHVPLDDIPPTDNSRTSLSTDSFSTITSDDCASLEPRMPKPSDRRNPISHHTLSDKSCSYSNERKEAINDHDPSWSNASLSSKEQKEPFNNQDTILCDERPSLSKELKEAIYNHDPIQVGFLTNELETFRQAPVSKSLGAFETVINATDVDVFSFHIGDQTYVYNVRNEKNPFKRRKAPKEPEVINYRLTSQSRDDSQHYHMRKSKKCTNLVLYKNLKDEPTLNKPLSKCMLLGKYHLKVSKDSFKSNTVVKMDKSIKSLKNSEAQAVIADKQPANEELTSLSDYDKITEKLLITIFGKNRNTKNDDEFVLSFVKQAVKEIYDVKLTQAVHPIKQLFKCLLQYWLLNTSVPSYRDAMQHAQSISIPSLKHFTKDANLSGLRFSGPTKATQFHGISDTSNEPEIKDSSCDYYDKDRQIQELERLMKNTVYTCEVPRVEKINPNRAMLSRDMINGLGSLTCETSASFNTTSSSELPKLEETIRNLVQDYTVPPTVAKDFLNAYLDMLLMESHDYSGTSCLNTREISRLIVDSYESEKVENRCFNNASTMVSQEVVLQKSKSTQNIANSNFDIKAGPSLVQFVDYAEQYVPLDAGFDLIDKIAAVFSKIYKVPAEVEPNTKNSIFELNPIEYKFDLEPIAEKDSACSESADVFTLDLCQYNLYDVSINKDSTSKGLVAITITLREKALDKEINKSLTNSNSDIIPGPHPSVTDEWMSKLSILQPKNKSSKIQINNFDSLYLASKNDIQPYATSQENSRDFFPSEQSIDSSFQSSNDFNPNRSNHDYADLNIFDSEDLKQCYVLTALKKQCIENSKKVKRAEPCLSHVDQGDMAQQEELVAIAKSDPKLIDEKLILLLLENLKLLSQNVPSMHKDVDHLCEKLKKKYEKHIRVDQVIQRLGFLGDIYKGEIDYDNDNFERSVENYPQHSSDGLESKDVQVATDDARLGNVTATDDKSLMTYAATEDKTTYVEADVSYFYVETVKESINDETCLSNEFLAEQEEEKSLVEPIKIYRSKIHLVDTTASTTSFTIEREMSEKAVSVQKWNAGKAKRNPTFNNRMAIKSNAAANQRASEKKIRETSATSSKPFCNKLPKRTIQSKPTTILTKNVKKCNKATKANNKVRDTLLKDISKYGWWKVAHSPDTNLVKERKKMALSHNAMYEVLFNRKATQSMSRSGSQLVIPRVSSDDLKTIYRCKSEPSFCSGLVSPSSSVRGPQAGFVSGTPGGRLASWIIESGGPLENASKELGQAQLSVQQLQRLLDALDMQQQVHHDTDVSLEGASPNVKKDRRKFGLRKKKSSGKCASVDLAPPLYMDPSNSHMALSTLTAPPSPGGGASSMPNSAASLPIACAAARPQSLPGAESLGGAGPASLSSLTPDHQLREDFTVLAKDLVGNLKSIVGTLVCERARLRAAMDAADTTSSPGGAMVTALRTNLSSALQQNSELRSRLSRIHDASDLAEISSVGHNSDPQQVSKHLQQSLSYSSSCVSASEFFDAEEHDPQQETDQIAADEAGVIELDGDSSSEVGSLSSEEGSASSDNSDGALLSAEPVTLRLNENGMGSSTESRTAGWTRRKRLPCPRPTPGGPSLWNLLYKNIGKDLSQISMPVTINEPLNMLQRLCEELEYSELLDSASECSAPLERTALVAAFAVSAYASSAHRAASKPFNPLLAETYECIRDDRAFRFVAEQVSHHPPISACHAESPRWVFWQEARIKTKFWGKSMEFQPAGRVHVRLLTTGDHYSWNKVTTCVHNLFGGQRWVDQYGDMTLTCHGTDISAKLNFVKASPWSTSRHEVRGAVTQTSSGARLRLQGRWSEALHAGEPPAARCLWRPGAMPPEHELYYGFTRFAMELNELEPGMKEILPHTDTRLRPDQRALEEGDVEGAEHFKHRLEQSQRERRRDSPEHTPRWFRKSMEGGEEMWVFNGEYWKARETGFPDNTAPRIW